MASIETGNKPGRGNIAWMESIPRHQKMDILNAIGNNHGQSILREERQVKGLLYGKSLAERLRKEEFGDEYDRLSVITPQQFYSRLSRHEPYTPFADRNFQVRIPATRYIFSPDYQVKSM